MTSDRLHDALLNARVPRYTSYPPANQFTPAVGAATHAAWLRAVPPGEAVSLYVHVPFCRRLCWFCACRTQSLQDDASLDRYLDHLEAEVALVRWHLPEELRISALHLGGGTPTLLSPDRLDRLGAIFRRAFPLDNDTEVSAEIDPCECDDARLDALARLGLSRASVGVQDLDPVVQRAIGRNQSVEITKATIRGLRDRGIRSVNVDLLYGLPRQTTQRLSATLGKILSLAPDRIALYGYAHVPWTARRQRMIPEASLPTSEERLALSALGRNTLVAAGYQPVGIDHFARPTDTVARAAREGRLHRDFQGYTTDGATTLVGLGPSSISRFVAGYSQNAVATGGWQRAISEGRLPTARGYTLAPQDRVAGRIIEELMCYGITDLARIAPVEEVASYLDVATKAVSDWPGIAEVRGSEVRLSDISFARLLAHRFDPFSSCAVDRFSRAS